MEATTIACIISQADLQQSVELTHLVVKWSQKSVKNRNFFENAGHVSFSFCQTGSAETHKKPCKTSPQGTSIKRPAIYWDHAVSWGGGVWVSVSDIGRVGKKMVLRSIPIYFLSTSVHDLRPKLASQQYRT